jgi:hypothetical protein
MVSWSPGGEGSRLPWTCDLRSGIPERPEVDADGSLCWPTKADDRKELIDDCWGRSGKSILQVKKVGKVVDNWLLCSILLKLYF